jgi:hypothetical protein
MNNPFLESPVNLRKDWKKLRNSLVESQSDIEQLETVFSWWGKCPVASQWLDYDRTENWPDPWELITTKNLDYSAISLGIEYTLLLCGDERWTADRVQVWLASDINRTMQHLVTVIDNKMVLNACSLKIVDLDPSLIVHSRYKFNNKKHIEI